MYLEVEIILVLTTKKVSVKLSYFFCRDKPYKASSVATSLFSCSGRNSLNAQLKYCKLLCYLYRLTHISVADECRWC